MAYQDFSNDVYFIQVTATNTATPLGQIALTESTNLSNIVLHAQKVGTHTTETLQVEIHNQETVDTPIWTSDVYSYGDFSIAASHWAGTLTFDFGRVPLNSELSYWVKVRALNYSYTDDVKYIAFAMDWPFPINTQDTPNFPGAAIGIYGRKE